MGEPADRLSQQTQFFGSAGRDRLAQARVAILGLGGLGSHVSQQLAYLGVQNYILVDHDTVDTTNLNRLIGATLADVDKLKVEIAKRTILAVEPDALVSPIERQLPNDQIAAALNDVDIVIGCFDNDYARLLALAEASQLAVPYVDAATDIADHGSVYGGRVVVSGQGRGCLHCRGMLDQDQIRRAQMTQEQLEVEARTYGVPVEELLPGTGPSVVTLNGVVASLAATEAMAIITGLRDGTPLQTYYGHWGRITTNLDPPAAECYYCLTSAG
jgi:molybdopterin/thiamine biosynthesis adenylyltransferase